MRLINGRLIFISCLMLLLAVPVVSASNTTPANDVMLAQATGFAACVGNDLYVSLSQSDWVPYSVVRAESGPNLISDWPISFGDPMIWMIPGPGTWTGLHFIYQDPHFPIWYPVSGVSISPSTITCPTVVTTTAPERAGRDMVYILRKLW